MPLLLCSPKPPLAPEPGSPGQSGGHSASCFVRGCRITVVADDQSGLAEAPGDLPLEPQDLGCYAVAVLYEGTKQSSQRDSSLTPRPRTYLT